MKKMGTRKAKKLAQDIRALMNDANYDEVAERLEATGCERLVWIAGHVTRCFHEVDGADQGATWDWTMDAIETLEGCY